MSARRPDTGALVMQHVHDSLQARGITFTQSFVSSPLCAPSRASFLTGQYVHNHGVQSNSGAYGGYGALDHTRTLPVWLRRAGYHCVHVGKYLNGYAAGDGIPPGWNEWYTAIDAHYFDFELDENGTLVQYGHGPDDYETDVLARKAVRFLESHASSPEPFFLLVDFGAPHKTSPPVVGTGSRPVPAPRDAAVFTGFRPWFPPSFDEADVGDKPPDIQNLPLLSISTIRSIVKVERDRLGTLLAVDDGVARILDALESTGQLEDTFVFYTSDNGFEQGEHRIATGKDVLYEESIRVPLVVRGPGVLEGVEESPLVSCIDLAPTMIELAGATADLPIDGRSLLPLFSDGNAPWRRDVIVEIFHATGPIGTPSDAALCSNEDRYFEHDLDGDGIPDEIELYAMAHDPAGAAPDRYELRSQHANPLEATPIRRMHARLEELESCAGAGCR